MINFEALVKAIHKSINDAAKSVEADGVRHLNKFFYEVDEKGEAIENGQVTKPEEDDDKKDQADNNKPAQQFLVRDFESGKKYRPKTVLMEFPSRTANGIETVEVEVPLIVLSTISTPKVSHAKFTADLEVSTDEDGNLKVGFVENKGGFFKSKENANTHIEVTIEAAESPEGLQKVISGYERALRAQIPG